MAREIIPLVDLVREVGPTPKGVDQIDYIIASLPGHELSRSAEDSTYFYERSDEIVDEDPAFKELFDNNPVPEKRLADDILFRQKKLTSTRRYLATLSSILILGPSGYLAGYKLNEQVQLGVYGNPPHVVDNVQPGGKPLEKLDGEIVGGLAGVLGGVTVFATCYFQSGRLARRPAQRKVDKARTARLKS